MAKLVIVESPAKAKTIGKYLGDDYEVTASMGHIRDLPASQLGIDVEHGYAPQYISIKGKEKLIKELKSKAKHADGVLLATDPDREGEAISWHLANILGLDPHEPNRVTFDEITKKGVKEGMAHPRAIDEDLFNAQQARRVPGAGAFRQNGAVCHCPAHRGAKTDRAAGRRLCRNAGL